MLPKALPQENSAATTSGAELRNFLEATFVVTYVLASLRELTLLSGAILNVCGQMFPCTQSFLEDLAGFITMPTDYAYAIDFDLFVHNFHERKRIKDQAVQVCIVAGRAVGLAAGDYRPARTIDVLNALPSADEGFWNVQSATLNDRNVEINLVSEDFVLEPIPNDVIRCGIRLSNSEAGGCGLKACFWTLRLICLNGAVMSDSLGTVYWNYDRRVTYVASIAKFIAQLVNLRNKQDQLKQIYSNAVSRPLLEEQFPRLWRRIRSAGKFTPGLTNLILGIDDQERRRLVSAVASRQAANESPEESPWDAFTIHNRITAAAKLFPFAVRSRLECIGGDVLNAWAQN
jgi:hypothetical protein